MLKASMNTFLKCKKYQIKKLRFKIKMVFFYKPYFLTSKKTGIRENNNNLDMCLDLGLFFLLGTEYASPFIS